MERKEYSAGAVKVCFWFMEFKKVVTLLNDGRSLEDVKRLNQQENIFSAPTPLRAGQIFNTVSARVKSLDSSFYPLFMDSDLATQKLIALVAAMAQDTLFFDFVYEVIREKLVIGINEFADSDVSVFFKDKQQQDRKVAGWTDMTLNRLGQTYKTMLYEAGVIDKSKDTRKILKPILAPEFEKWLQENEMEICVKALTGVS